MDTDKAESELPEVIKNTVYISLGIVVSWETQIPKIQ